MIRTRASFSGDFDGWTRELLTLKAAAVTTAVAAATEGAKTELRRQIEASGLGTRFGNMVGSKVFPVGRPSLKAAGTLFARGPRADLLLGAHGADSIIRGKDGTYLAIPTEAAGRLTPREFERRTGARLHLIYRRGRPSLLVAHGMTPGRAAAKRGFAQTRGFRLATPKRMKSGRGTVDVIAFVLVPQVRLRQRYDAAAIVRRWADRVPELIARALGG